MKISKIFFSFILVSYSACFGVIPENPSEIPSGSVSVKYPLTSQKVLPNGLTIIFNKRNDLPLVSGAVYLPKGASSGNCGIPGLNGISVDQMREGGTKSFTPDALDVFLDRKAAQIESSQAEDYSSFSFSALAEDFSDVFGVFSEVILSPRFDDSRLSLAKNLNGEEIARRKDDPGTMASMAFSLVSYGEGSIWYDPSSLASLKKIDRSNVTKYHQSLVSPKEAYLIVSGNVDEEEFFKAAEKFFGKWSDSNKSCLEGEFKKEGSKLINHDQPTLYVLPRDFEQTTLVMGHHGPTLVNLDIYKMVLFNRIFGSGSFDSLLFREIRDKRGLAYGVSGGLASTKKRGMFTVSLATRSSAVPEAIRGIEEVLESVNIRGFSDQEVSGAIRSSLQTFVFKFEDPFYAASRPALLKLSGFPSDYDTQYQTMIPKIGNQELMDFGRKIQNKTGMVTVIVGKTSTESIKKELGDKYKVCELSFSDVPSLKKCY